MTKCGLVEGEIGQPCAALRSTVWTLKNMPVVKKSTVYVMVQLCVNLWMDFVCICISNCSGVGIGKNILLLSFMLRMLYMSLSTVQVILPQVWLVGF